MLDTRSNSNVLDHLMLELARYPNFGENHMLELARYPNFLMLAHPYPKIYFKMKAKNFDFSTTFRKKGNLILGGEINNNLSSCGPAWLGVTVSAYHT